MLRAIEVPQTTAQALNSLTRMRDAAVIAGGTTVMPRVQAGDSGIGALVSLGRLKLDRRVSPTYTWSDGRRAAFVRWWEPASARGPRARTQNPEGPW